MIADTTLRTTVTCMDTVLAGVQRHIQFGSNTVRFPVVVTVIVSGDQFTGFVIQPEIRVSSNVLTGSVRVRINHDNCFVGLDSEPPVGFLNNGECVSGHRWSVERYPCNKQVSDE